MNRELVIVCPFQAVEEKAVLGGHPSNSRLENSYHKQGQSEQCLYHKPDVKTTRGWL